MGDVIRMHMAKASDIEIERAIILAGLIEDAESGQFPRWTDGEFKEDDPEHFDEDDIDHLKEFYKRVTRLSPGLFRVVFGFSTLMNPVNQLVDHDKEALALHPRLIKALEQSKWIPITESKPDADLTVLTYAPRSNEPVWPGYLGLEDDKDVWMDTSGSIMATGEITHWMLFPDPPEQPKSS